MTHTFLIHKANQPMQHKNREASGVSSKKILVVEDELDIAQLIKIHLSDICQHITLVHDGAQAAQLAKQQTWDAIILDLKLPNMDGLEVCRRVRADNQLVPILMLTAKSTELDRVLGLEMGADDYLAKPFSVLELVARVKALLRRASATQQNQQTPDKIVCDDLEINPEQRAVTLCGRQIKLTAKEFDLLHFFYSTLKIAKNFTFTIESC